MAGSVEDKGSLTDRLDDDRQKMAVQVSELKEDYNVPRRFKRVGSEISLVLDYGCGAGWFFVLAPAGASQRSLSVGGSSSGKTFTRSTPSSCGEG